MRALAVVSLGETDSPDTIEYLQKLSNDKNDRIRDAAGRALSRIESDAAGAA